MAFVSTRKASRAEAAMEVEKIVCVTAICALALLPLVFSVALTIWGA